MPAVVHAPLRYYEVSDRSQQCEAYIGQSFQLYPKECKSVERRLFSSINSGGSYEPSKLYFRGYKPVPCSAFMPAW